jgi:periplasmic protein TonB
MTEAAPDHSVADDAPGAVPDETIVPTFDRPVTIVKPPRRRSGLLLAAGLSIALHAGVVALAAWAFSGGLVSLELPTLGSRGEMAEGGLSDDPGVSALSDAPFIGNAPPAAAPAATPFPVDDLEEFPADVAEAFAATPAEAPHADPVPPIGPDNASSVIPSKLPSKRRARASAPSEPSAAGQVAAGGTPSPDDDAARVRVASTSASAASSATGIGAARYSPPHPAGRGSGLSGRRGARGVDSRGLPIPDYPRESRRRGEQGTVVLDVGVGPDGHVESVVLVSSSGYPRLDEAAAVAIREAEFTPAVLGGRAVGGTVRVPYRFRLD